eukprot:8639506-Alexandrium_andersonii.AAC.1
MATRANVHPVDDLKGESEPLVAVPVHAHRVVTYLVSDTRVVSGLERCLDALDASEELAESDVVLRGAQGGAQDRGSILRPLLGLRSSNCERL